MRFSLLTSKAARTFVLLGAVAPLSLKAQVIEDTTPDVFDGQYIPTKGTSVEWWWAQAIAEPVGGNPPAAFQMLFYQGYPFQIGPRDPSLPEFYMVINGFFPNGTQFAFTIPATSGNVSASGQTVTGKWGDVGAFNGSPDLSTWTATFSAPSLGVQGTVAFKSNAQHHFGCNTTSTPYFASAIPAGESLNDAEKVLYQELGWATTIPGGTADVNVSLNGAQLAFSGFGYHDANWAPVPLNDAVSTWFFGSAQIGPYDLSYISVTPTNSTKVLNTGYLSRDGVVLQNQCSLNGTKTNDHSIVTPYGLEHDEVSGVTIPAGFIIEYILANGEHFAFNLTSINGAQNPDQNVYHRWVGTGSGGKVGEVPSTGLTVFEWLNPGLTVYPPSS